MDLSRPLSKISIEFGDGTLECEGHMETAGGEFVSCGDDETVEHAVTIYVEVVCEGRVIYGGDILSLRPGRYLIDDTGLYQRFDFDDPSSHS